MSSDSIEYADHQTRKMQSSDTGTQGTFKKKSKKAGINNQHAPTT